MNSGSPRPSSYPTVNVCGVGVTNVTMDEAVAAIDGLIRERRHAFVATPNTDHVVNIARDAEFRRIYRDAALVLADGMPLLWIAKLLGTPLKEKVSGSDLFPRLCEVAAQKQHRLFFLGGRPGAADGAAEILRRRHPGLQIAGVYSPPLGFEKDPAENAGIVRMIRDSRPDILFVGLGSPKQERWIAGHKDDVGVPVSIGIGVSFEFVAGMVRRAPRWMQNAGMEWLWRLMMEPGRLWKRYLVNDTYLIVLFLRQWLQKKKSSSSHSH